MDPAISKRLFRQRHPIVVGFAVLGLVMFLYWGGITFFISKATLPSNEFFGPSEGVGIIEIKGVIVSADEWIRQLSAFRKDRNIKAIIVRIDSPGGAVGASQELYDEIRRTNNAKPVVASMGSIAASGGYYASLGAERILANAGTMTGSIGVIIKIANLKDLFEKIGYQSEVVKSGNLKDIGSPDRPLSREERRSLQNVIDDVHSQFVMAVSERRGLPLDEVQQLADGRVLSGKQAMEHGLVDEIGNFTDAVKVASLLAGLKAEEPELIYPKEDKLSFYKLLTGESENSVLQRFINHSPILSFEWSMNE